MSRNLETRLARLEAESEPKVLGYWHFIYARDMADFERQRAGMIEAGKAKACDLFLDCNFKQPEYLTEAREPETHAVTKPLEEWLGELEKPDV